MENIPNTNISENEADSQIAPSNPVSAVQNSPVAEEKTQPSQGFNPIYTQPVYSSQYNNQPGATVPPYVPGGYSAPSYTPQTTPPYNGQPSFNTAYNSPGYGTSPSEIYNNTPHGNVPQYHYGDPSFNVNFNNAYYYEHQRKIRERKQAEREIRQIGNISGGVLIACLLVAVIFSSVLALSPVYQLYTSNLTVSSFVNMLYTLVVVGGTFLVFGKFYKSNEQRRLSADSPEPKIFKNHFNGPENKLKAALLIIISFGGCMLANYISSFILGFFSIFGVESTYSSIQDPKTYTDLIMMCLGVAVIPPLVEEYALRGVALSSLRRYGNSFAIIASAIMFGLFHGDAMQIPFAFICGLFFAYAVIATNSLWTGIIIHALNNILSCVASVLMQVSTEDAANTFFNVVSIGGIILGVICLVIYLSVFKNDGVIKFKGNAQILTTGQKIGKFITSPVMIIAIILYGIEALGTLKLK